MAFRVLARRLSGPQMETALMRPGRQQTRGFAEEYTGKGLNEKEKAAENRFIKKMEEEQKLKAAAKAKAAESAGSGTGTPAGTPTLPGKPEYPGPTPESGFRNTAVVAGIVALIAGYWLLGRSSKDEDKSKA